MPTRSDGQPGPKIYAAAADADVLEQGGTTEDFHSFFPVKDAPLLRFDIDVRIETTSELNIAGIDLTAILCPGHTAGSACYLLQRAGRTVLFGGDTVMTLEGDLGTFGLYYDARYGSDPDAYLSTLETLREIPVNVLLPGHPSLDRDPSPLVGPDGWRNMIDRGIAETRMLIERYRRDGRAFLNGDARRIAPNLLYLGDFSDGSAYALEGEEGIVIVDPPVQVGIDDLFEVLEELGANGAQIRGILLTTVSRETLECSREIMQRTGASLWRPDGGESARDAETILAGGRTLS